MFKEVMRMDIAHKRFNRADLLSLKGRLDAASAPQLKQQIESLFPGRKLEVKHDILRITPE